MPNAEVARITRRDGLRLAPYAQAPQALGALAAGSVLLLDPKRVTLGLREAVAAEGVEHDDGGHGGNPGRRPQQSDRECGAGQERPAAAVAWRADWNSIM